LATALPDGTERAAAIERTVRGLDTAIAGLTPSVQGELAQLFVLLRAPATRVIATGVMRPWHLAGENEIERFLRAWRFSPFTRLRGAYDAIHQLTYAAWYGSNESWSAIGYPGPPAVA